MSTAPKISLAVSVTAFVLSFAPYFNDLGWGILRPVSAVAFIIFAITHFLAKEMALYDEEQQRGHAPSNQNNNSTKSSAGDRQMGSMKPSMAK